MAKNLKYRIVLKKPLENGELSINHKLVEDIVLKEGFLLVYSFHGLEAMYSSDNILYIERKSEL